MEGYKFWSDEWWNSCTTWFERSSPWSGAPDEEMSLFECLIWLLIALLCGYCGFAFQNSSRRRSKGSERISNSTRVAPNGRRRPETTEEFEVAIICALKLEADAVLHMFDWFWDDDEDGGPYKKAPRDLNEYRTGLIGKDDVVLLVLPGMGKVNAARAMSALLSSYPNIRLALVVGVCGGVPEPIALRHEEISQILLGDVVISSRIVEFDFGRQYPTGFQVNKSIREGDGRAEKDVKALLQTFSTWHGRKRLVGKADLHLRALQNPEHPSITPEESEARRKKYCYLGTSKDKLFLPAYNHRHHQLLKLCGCSDTRVCESAVASDCSETCCDERQLVTPRNRISIKQEWETVDAHESQRPVIHIGAMASSDTVMKSAKDRDRIANLFDVIAFEMEGAGIWDTPELSCLVIKGVCDYADSHKNKKWQDFAAATAASTMKALLEERARPDSRVTEMVASREALQAENNVLRRAVMAQTFVAGAAAGGAVTASVLGKGPPDPAEPPDSARRSQHKSDSAKDTSGEGKSDDKSRYEQQQVQQYTSNHKPEAPGHTTGYMYTSTRKGSTSNSPDDDSSSEENNARQGGIENKRTKRKKPNQQKPNRKSATPTTKKIVTATGFSTAASKTSQKTYSSQHSGSSGSAGGKSHNHTSSDDERPESSSDGWMYRGSNTTSSYESGSNTTSSYASRPNTTSSYESGSNTTTSHTRTTSTDNRFSGPSSGSGTCYNSGRNGTSRFEAWYCHCCGGGPQIVDLIESCEYCYHMRCVDCTQIVEHVLRPERPTGQPGMARYEQTITAKTKGR
ncbi:hypothetical protein QBC43DRAFT_12231 [Cladorrhinum sp. PSN259]|nr:hypothetical protein QBC43DRAFT_12231 [Cladorrhinum sp. PSN259]